MPTKILGATGWIGVALVFAAVVARLVIPEQQALWWWLAVAGLALVVLYTLGQWREVVGLFSRRQARYGALATSSVLIAAGILVAVNYITNRQNKRWDLTAAQQYSLSEQTRRILESLESPIAIRVFAREEEFPGFRDRLDEYAYTSSQVSVEYVDVDRNPVLAREYEIQSYGTVVFDYEGRVERVVSTAEQELTNALIKAVEGEERTVYFVQGHGERLPKNTERDGYSTLTEALRLDNLTVQPVVLAQTGEVPADAAVVVIAGPTTDFLEPEVALLRRYLEAGGKALFLLDPPATTDAPDVPNLVELVAEWGIEVGRNVVVDVSGVGQLLGTDASVPVAATYPPHPITERFNLLTAYPLARSVEPATGAPNGRVADRFIETSPRSWAESNLAELATGEVALNEDQGDAPGPVSIAAAVSVDVEASDSPETSEPDAALNDETAGAADADDDAEEPEPVRARVAVIGDSDFASNGALGIQGNRDLALNTVNWLAQQENLIAIRPREPEDRRITLTADQQFRIWLLSLFMVPAVILGTGIYTWWRRR